MVKIYDDIEWICSKKTEWDIVMFPHSQIREQQYLVSWWLDSILFSLLQIMKLLQLPKWQWLNQQWSWWHEDTNCDAQACLEMRNYILGPHKPINRKPTFNTVCETTYLLLMHQKKHTFSLSETFVRIWDTFAVGLLTFPTLTCTGLVKYSWNWIKTR